MDIDHLRTFVDVMRRGSFAAVARERNVDPSSISRAIAGIERQLGVRLFNRTTRHLSPTEAAAAYCDRIEPSIAELERATLAAGDSGDTVRGTLRITAAVTFAHVNIVPLLPEFARRHPQLGFELILTDAFVDLVAERIDVAVRLGRPADSSLIAQRLCDMVYVVCASPDYLRRNGRPKTPRELEHHECLRYLYPVQGYGPRWRFRRGDDPVFEVPVRGRIAATNGVALRQCAVAGMGILMLPRWNVADELRTGALVELFPDHIASAADFDVAAWMLFPSRAYLPRKVRAFTAFMKEKFAHGPPAEVGLAPRLRGSGPQPRRPRGRIKSDRRARRSRAASGAR